MRCIGVGDPEPSNSVARPSYVILISRQHSREICFDLLRTGTLGPIQRLRGLHGLGRPCFVAAQIIGFIIVMALAIHPMSGFGFLRLIVALYAIGLGPGA